MSTHSLKDLRTNLGNVVREVAYSGNEAVITDSGTEIAVIIGMDDYERLHEHADVADALELREMRATGFQPLTMAQMLERLGIPVGPPEPDQDQIAKKAPAIDLMDALRESVERARDARVSKTSGDMRGREPSKRPRPPRNADAA